MATLPVRELDALRSCIITWRRALLDLRYQSGDEPRLLDAEHGDLVAYADAAGESAPFARAVLAASVGSLEQPALMVSLYRTDVATSIAWALRLVDAIPSPDTPADLTTLDGLLPLYGAPSERVAGATLRDARDIASEHTRTRERLAAARDRSQQDPQDNAAGAQLSRLYWRCYGLQWLLGSATHVEETELAAF